jgi:hypothetical protein
MVGDTFPGTDELFGASVEGLAATPALAARKGMYTIHTKHTQTIYVCVSVYAIHHFVQNHHST